MQFPLARTLCATTAISALAIGSLVAATGAGASGTTTTFTLGSGALSISAPASAALGAGSPGAALSNQLGAVTVTDARASLVATWIATASSSTFITGAGGAGQVIPLADVDYASGLATATSGVGVMTPGQLVTAPATLTTPVTAYSLAAGVGNNSATWNPTITVNIPAAAVAGTYTATITHSVA